MPLVPSVQHKISRELTSRTTSLIALLTSFNPKSFTEMLERLTIAAKASSRIHRFRNFPDNTISDSTVRMCFLAESECRLRTKLSDCVRLCVIGMPVFVGAKAATCVLRTRYRKLGIQFTHDNNTRKKRFTQKSCHNELSFIV